MSRFEQEAEELLAGITPETEAHEPNSHLANAHRIARHYGDGLLYVEGIGWHVWGPPWRHDDLGARRIAQGLGRIIADEANGLSSWAAKAVDKEERERRVKVANARFKWASFSESAGNIEASMRLAQPLLSCKAGDLDAKPMLLGLPSGVLDLATVEHRAHRQGDYITKVAGTDCVAGSACPTWEKFLGEVFANDEAMIAYVQRLAGYSLSGQRGEHVLPILWGGGANGKSTFLGTLQSMLGDYAGTAAPGLLMHRFGSSHPTELASLQGRRLVVSSETGEGGRLNEDLVKSLTGGDLISARRMHHDFYEFRPSHLLVLQTNHMPRVSGTDEGIWRRLQMVPFTTTIPPEKRDPLLPDKLRNELPGILQWSLDGWRMYQATGLQAPDSVRAATSEYRSASDHVGAFLDECCTVALGFTASAKDLYSAYSEWCKEGGEHPRTQTRFGLALRERGFDSYRTGSGTRWRGLTPTTETAMPWGRDRAA